MVLEWAAGSDTDGLTGFKIEREAPTGTTAMVHADLIDDERPMLESSVLSMNDETAPASWVVFYRVWAVFSDGEKEKEVVSWWFPATMDGGIVRAIQSTDKLRISWTDALSDCRSIPRHGDYGVYMEESAGVWSNIQDVVAQPDTDPAPRSLEIGRVGNVFIGVPVRVRCGGDSGTTGTLIGETNFQ